MHGPPGYGRRWSRVFHRETNDLRAAMPMAPLAWLEHADGAIGTHLAAGELSHKRRLPPRGTRRQSR